MTKTFAALGISERATAALRDRGIDTPLPVQGLVIPSVLDGEDVLVKSPTGSGKTLAFGLPLIERLQRGGANPQALVLAPTRELAGQIVDELQTIADGARLRITAVYGGANIKPQIRDAQTANILVATPGRLVDLIDRGAVSLKHVDILVLDEADRMLDMGFKPVVQRLVRMTPADRQTLLFSATLDGPVLEVANAFTRNPVTHEHAHAALEQGKIEHRFLRVEHADKLEHLISELHEDGRGRTVVFVRTKRGADRLAKKLAARDIRVVAMHGNKSQSQREKALARFEDGRADTLVATDVAARGIDVSGVTHVINFDAPAAKEDYVHRVGRTARAGASGVGITFVMGDQVRDVVKLGGQLGLHSELEAGGLGGGSSSHGGLHSNPGHKPRGSRHPRGNGGKPRNKGNRQRTRERN